MVGGVTEYCCSPFDNQTNCVPNTTNGVVCSDWYSNGVPLFYTYCMGASYPETCGVSSNEIQADGSVQTVNVSSLPYDVVDSNSITYLACYYHIYAQPYSWKSGA